MPATNDRSNQVRVPTVYHELAGIEDTTTLSSLSPGIFRVGWPAFLFVASESATGVREKLTRLLRDVTRSNWLPAVAAIRTVAVTHRCVVEKPPEK
jgi:hypothetical protein